MPQTRKKKKKTTRTFLIKVLNLWRKNPFYKDVEEAVKWIREEDKRSPKDAIESENLLIIVWVSLGILYMYVAQFLAIALFIPILFSIAAHIISSYGPVIYAWSNELDLGVLKLFGKPIWEWVKVLAVPLTLSIGGYLFRNVSERKEIDRKNEERLNQYLEQVSNLILSDYWPENLEEYESHKKAYQYSKTISLIRARTLGAIRELDKKRTIALLKFLGDSGVINLIPFERLELSSTVIRAANFSNVVFNRVNLKKATLMDISFSGAELKESNFRFSKIENVNFNSADLSNSDFFFSSMTNVHFQNSTLSNSNFEHSNMKRIDFSASTLCRSRFVTMRLKEPDFSDATLEKATFDSINLANSNFQNANLSKSKFSTVSLVNSNFQKANLSESKFSKVNLKNANFENADLREISFSAKDNWEESVGLELAHNVPISLLDKLQMTRLKKKSTPNFKALD